MSRRRWLTAEPATRPTVSHDEYGYTWVTVHRADADLSALVTALHAVNTTLADVGFGPSLLCTIIGFAGTVDGHPTRRFGLVYLFKRGTVYPFAPPAGSPRHRTAYVVDLYHRLPAIQKRLVDIDGSVYWMLSHPRQAATLIGDWFSVSLTSTDTTTTA